MLLESRAVAVPFNESLIWLVRLQTSGAKRFFFFEFEFEFSYI